MIKKMLMLAQLLLAAFLVKFLDADSGGSDSDSGGSDSADSDSGSLEGSSELASSSSETAAWSDTDSGDSNSDSSSRKKPVPRPEDLQNLSFGDLSQIPRRDDNIPGS